MQEEINIQEDKIENESIEQVAEQVDNVDSVETIDDIKKMYEEKIQDLTRDLQRERAEFMNYRKRAQEEKLKAQAQAGIQLLEQTMPVLDSFDQLFQMQESAENKEEQSLKKFFEGASIVQKQLWGIFASSGLTEINPLGQEYDALCMEAMGSVEKDDVEKETVITVYQKGYQLENRILRPARVMVAKPSSVEKK